MFNILLKNELKSMFNSLRTQKTSYLIGYAIIFLFLSAFIGFASFGIFKISPELTTPMIRLALSYGSLVMMGFILLLGVPQVFKDLYATGDLDLLFTLPIKTRHIFWVKYLKGFAGTPLLAFVFFIVPSVTYGIAIGAHPLYYPALLLGILSILVTALSLAYLVNLILIQIVPASRANEFMTVMSLLSGFIIYLILMLPNFLQTDTGMEQPLTNIPVFPAYTPMSWLSEAVISASSGSVAFLWPLLLLILLATATLALATSLVEKGFRTGWIRLSEGSTKKKKKRKTKIGTRLNSPVIAIGKKEWYAIKRDVREWMVLLPIGIFFIFALIGMFNTGGAVELSDIRSFTEISWPIAQAVFLFTYIFTCGLIAASSIGREGHSLWILNMLPIDGKVIARGKLWISWLLPFVLISLVELAVGLYLGWSVTQFILGFTMKALATVGLSAMGIWLGTLGARYNPSNPQQRVSFLVSMSILVASILYFIVVILPYAYLLVPADFLAELPETFDSGLTGFKALVVQSGFTLLTWKAASPLIANLISLVVLGLLGLSLTRLFIYLSGRRIDRGLDLVVVSDAKAKTKTRLGRKRPGESL